MASPIAATAQSVARRAPRLGNKQVYLPNFTLTLLRTPKLPPTFASFIVPLNLNKLDLRDYLWNCYGIPVRGVRSYIQMQKVRQDKPREKRPSPRKWFRPRSIKKMLVEMEQPFVWPEEPKDYDLWDKTTFEAAQKDREENEMQFRPGFREQPSSERGSVAEQAKAFLEAKEKWEAKEISEWEDMGNAVEVEQDVKI